MRRAWIKLRARGFWGCVDACAHRLHVPGRLQSWLCDKAEAAWVEPCDGEPGHDEADVRRFFVEEMDRVRKSFWGDQVSPLTTRWEDLPEWSRRSWRDEFRWQRREEGRT